jgi:Spy/CpxP family protein refolding chaperone
MKFPYLLVFPTALFLIPITSAIALDSVRSAIALNQSTVTQTNPTRSTLIAQCPPPPMGEVPGGDIPDPPWAKDINLTTQQREQIKTIHLNTRKETEGLHKQLFETEQKMRSLLGNEVSQEELKQQHEQIQKLHQQLDNKHFDSMLAERQVLTVEQRKQLSLLMPQHPKPPMMP